MQTIRFSVAAVICGHRGHCCRFVCTLAVVLSFWGICRQANAQAQLADDILLMSKGIRAQEAARTNSHLGTAPGAGENRFLNVPGGGKPSLGEPSTGSSLAQRDVLSAASASQGGGQLGKGAEPIITPSSRLPPTELPIYGSLELPAHEDEGPPDGLTLDMAIDRLVRENLDLRTKFQEIPKAEADILSAGLRGNPLIFASTDNVPYGRYTPQRPGETTYGITVIQPIDANQKRQVRILGAQRAKRVLDAQYQDAVRLAIDNLYVAFVDALATRETVRYIEASLVGLDEAVKKMEQLRAREERSAIELDRLMIQRDSALIALDEAKSAQAKAIQVLATQLNIPAIDSDRLSVRGKFFSVTDRLPRPDELIGLAIANRPDLMAYRLGIERAHADVDLAKAEAFPDIFVLYSPIGFRDNAPTGGQNATSWSLGVMASAPIFNRNQGNIRRAEINVSQTSTELAGVERHIQAEVLSAFKDYETAVAKTARLERDLLPRARAIRDRTFKLFRAGEEGAIGYLNAQREYSDAVRQFRDAVIRQRRAALRLNTVVALRIVP